MLQSMGPQRGGHDLATEQQLILHWGNCASKDTWPPSESLYADLGLQMHSPPGSSVT